MGRNSQLMEACLLYSRTVKPVTDMQDFSQKNSHLAMVYLQNALPMEGIQQENTDMPRKTSVDHTCARHETLSVDGVARFKSEVVDVAFEDSVPHSQNCSQYDSHLPGEFLRSQIISANDVQHSRCAKSCTQNSTTSIPLVPDIIIEHVPSSTALGHCQTSIFSTALHSSLAVGPSLGQKKGRTHSDSSIYEADKRKSCLRSSLSSLQSLFVEPSDVLVHRTISNIDSHNCGANPGTCDEVSPGTRKDGSDTFIEPESLNCSNRCRKPTLVLNFSGLDHFTAAQEKSPKTYWLRRHSDSNVAGGHETGGLHAEPYTLRSHSASDTIPEIQCDEGMDAEHTGEEVTAEKCFSLESSPMQSGSSDRTKCQKVKKYLQTRYQNQSLDMDDVFMDCSTETNISRPEQSLAEDAPAALLKSENVDHGVIVSDKEIQKLERSALLYLPKHLSLNSEDTVSCRANEIVTTTGSEKVRPKKLLRANNDSANVFENSSPSFSLSNSRQSVFEFPFPSPYSVLGDLPVGSGNIFFGLFPQGCLPSPFLPSPLTLESFTIESPASKGVLATPLIVSQDCAASNPSESKCWQSAIWGAASSPKKILKETDNELKARAGPGHELNRQAFLETQESLCSTTSASLESSSNMNQMIVKTLKSNDKPQSLVVSHEHLPDSSATSSPSALISPKPLLHTLSSPLPSSPVVGTPTRTSPQVVFNYQFSERIHEQRQTGDNFVCPVCGSLFLSYNSLANHVVSHLPSEVITQEGSDSSKVHLCKVCNRSFSRSDMLSRHMRLHTGLRPYECHLCRQVFSRSDHLHTHLRTHTGEKPYRCSHCMYAAPRRDMVTRHMRIHMRGSTRRGRRSSSTSSLASDSYQTSHVATNEQSAGSQTPKTKVPPERRKAGSFHKQRNWSVTSSENNEGPDGFDDKDLLKMTRTESTTSVDSGVSYLTPMSLAPSLWSPGIDSPDVFSRHPGGHFLWPSPELKHDLEKGSLAYTTRDMDFEMHASFQKCKVTSPAAQTSSQPTDELVEGQ